MFNFDAKCLLQSNFQIVRPIIFASLCSQVPLGRYVAFPGYIQVSQDCGQVLLKIVGISILSQPNVHCLIRPSYVCLIHFIKRCVSTKVSPFGSNVWKGWWQPADYLPTSHPLAVSVNNIQCIGGKKEKEILNYHYFEIIKKISVTEWQNQ